MREIRTGRLVKYPFFGVQIEYYRQIGFDLMWRFGSLGGYAVHVYIKMEDLKRI